MLHNQEGASLDGGGPPLDPPYLARGVRLILAQYPHYKIALNFDSG